MPVDSGGRASRMFFIRKIGKGGHAMFSQGDHIVYGSSGLCEITEIGNSPFDASDTRIFYALHPVLSASTTMIYTPVDNAAVVMRPPMTKSQARALVEKMQTIPPLTVEHEKLRRDVYRTALNTADPEKLVSLLRTVALRRLETLRHGRRLTDADTDNERRARNNLLGELSLSLGVSHDEISGLLHRMFAPEEQPLPAE